MGKRGLEPLVSVIVPVYNTERWLGPCLDSVLEQSLENIEVICVDDASTDGSADILAEYAARDARVHVVTLDSNCGQGVARNKGFSMSSGRYVHFLDSDDMLATSALEKLVERADAEDLDGVLFDASIIFETDDLARRFGSELPAYRGTYPVDVQPGAVFFDAFINQGEYLCYVQRQFWRADFLRTCGIEFPPWSPHEDEVFVFEALELAQRVALVREPFFIRRYREGSAMTRGFGLDNLIGYFRSYCKIIRFMDEHGIECVPALRNASRLYQRFDALYDRTADVDEVSAILEHVECAPEYRFFVHARKAFLYNGYLSPSVLERAQRAQRVFLYGAGIIAGNVADFLARSGIAIEGFLVTDAASNISAFKGHRVLSLSSVPCDAEALVIISVNEGFRPEIERLLDDFGWSHVYCREA